MAVGVRVAAAFGVGPASSSGAITLAENGHAAVHFPAEAGPERRRRQRWLRACDLLLLAIEEENFCGEASAPAPFSLVHAYQHLGGGQTWNARWPSGAALHEATLGLQGQFLRQPVAGAAPTMRG